MNRPARGSLHHVELWVPDLPRATTQWGWLLGQLSYAPFQDWPHGRSWRLGHAYLVIEQSPALAATGKVIDNVFITPAAGLPSGPLDFQIKAAP